MVHPIQHKVISLPSNPTSNFIEWLIGLGTMLSLTFLL